MKRMIKGLICCSLALLFSIVPVCTIRAAEVSISEKEMDKSNDKLRYGESEVSTIVKTEYHTTTVTPSGQPAGGISFPSGGSMYVNTSGGPTISVSFGASWGAVNASVSIGLAGNTSSIGGYILPAPDRSNRYIAKINKTYKIERKKIDVYQYNEYKYTYYNNHVTLYSESPYLVKVG